MGQISRGSPSATMLSTIAFAISITIPIITVIIWGVVSMVAATRLSLKALFLR